MVEGSNKT